MTGRISGILVSAVRFIQNNRLFFFLNLVGLAVGLGACLLLIQFGIYEFSFDRFHTDSERIFRVNYENYRNGAAEIRSAAAVPMVGKAMKDNFDEVEEFCWAFPVHNVVFKAGIRKYHEDKIQMVTPGFLRIFSWEFLYGNEESLDPPYSVVLTESTAVRYFGRLDCMGEVLEYSDNTRYTVRGIIKDVPSNSHLKFPLLVSPESMSDIYKASFARLWTWYDFNTYIKLKEGVDPDEFESEFDGWLSDQMSEFWSKQKRRQYFPLQGIERIHLFSKLSQESEFDESGNARLVFILCAIALSILFIAWINYINLSGGLIKSYSREVGLRKITGASNASVFFRFAFHAFIIHLLAAGLSLALVELSLPWFSKLSGREISMSLFLHPLFWIIGALLVLSGSIISALFPARVLLSCRPIDLISRIPENFQTGRKLRRILVILQFIVSVGFISGALVSRQQVNFLKNFDPGINLSQTLVLWGPTEYQESTIDKFIEFKKTLRGHQLFRNAAASDNVPGIEVFLSAVMRRDDEATGRIINCISADDSFLTSYEHEFIGGRNFNKNLDTLRSPLILNESALKILGYAGPEAAIGKKVWIMDEDLIIIGILKDYHQMPVKQKVIPLAFLYSEQEMEYLSIPVTSGFLKESLEFLSNLWKDYFDSEPFEYFNLDEQFLGLYRVEEQTVQSLNAFSLLAIFLALLGLYGLVTTASIQRGREIGIRKAHGASIIRLLRMLFRDYVAIILLAILISAPLVWIILKSWLNSFPLTIKINPVIFLAAGCIVLLVSLISVSVQLLRIVNISPARVLKYE